MQNIRAQWTNYENEELHILRSTGDTPHQAITPILRKEKDLYILDIALRNNRTSDAYPDGIFHPHPLRHHIKKENIGLIEVMGLAILPGRLDKDLKHIKSILSGKIETFTAIDTYRHWIEALKIKVQPKMDLDAFLQQEVGQVFVLGLEDCGVFKQDQKGLEAFKRFILRSMACFE